MTNYIRAQYGGDNPNAGFPANGDRYAWGGYAWPAGVPTGLLAATSYQSSFGQNNRVVMRRELVPLWNLAFELCDRKHHYCVWSVNNGEVWGPWGYENRNISGTQTASGHSMGLSVDINAPYNPYSYTFQSDMPPAMVADLESLGLYWGGRYAGQKYDAMHYGFCRAPGTLPQYIARARNLLGLSPAPTPGDDDMPLTDDDIKKIGDEVLKRLKEDDVVKYAYTDQGTGKETSRTVSVTEGIGSAATSSGRAAYQARQAAKQ